LVYVVQEVKGRDHSPALKYGDLKLLLEDWPNITMSTQPTVRRLRKMLKDFNDQDYLLLSGDPVALGLACAVAADINQGKVKILKWENREGLYYVLEANIRGGFVDE
jgi:hypothetical protein